MQDRGRKDSYLEHDEGARALVTHQVGVYVFDVLAHSLRVGVQAVPTSKRYSFIHLLGRGAER